MHGWRAMVVGAALGLSGCGGCVETGLDAPDAAGNISVDGGMTGTDAAVANDAGQEVDAGVDAGPRGPWDAGPGGCTQACGTWRSTTPMPAPRNRHTATLLADGRVLIAGGEGDTGPLASALLFNPQDETWTETGALRAARYLHTATLLDDGRVLVTGGVGNPPSGGFGALATAEVYNPAGGSWSFVGALASPRTGHTATRLQDGRVVVAGGTSDSAYLTSVEVYAPATERFLSIGSIMQPRHQHAAAELGGNRVLVVGGQHITEVLMGAELFTNTAFSMAPPMPGARWGHAATPLDDDRVLVTGGYLAGPVGEPALFNAMVNAWSTPSAMTQPRWGHEAVKLQDGDVLIIGGVRGGDDGSTLAHCELYDVDGGSFREVRWMAAPRLSHTATVLADGRVLVVGGTVEFEMHATAEIYTP